MSAVPLLSHKKSRPGTRNLFKSVQYDARAKKNYLSLREWQFDCHRITNPRLDTRFATDADTNESGIIRAGHGQRGQHTNNQIKTLNTEKRTSTDITRSEKQFTASTLVRQGKNILN